MAEIIRELDSDQDNRLSNTAFRQSMWRPIDHGILTILDDRRLQPTNPETSEPD